MVVWPVPASEVEVDNSLIFALSEGSARPRPAIRSMSRRVIAGEFEELGLSSKIEYATHNGLWPHLSGHVPLIALLAGPLARSPQPGPWQALGKTALGAAESGFALRSPLNLLQNHRSQNVWA